jgi:hypothetical protein
MECKATTANHDIAYKGNQKNCIVSISETIPNTFDTEGNKQKVREGVNDLGTVDRGIVVFCG